MHQVRALLRCGASVDVKDDYGETPTSMCCAWANKANKANKAAILALLRHEMSFDKATRPHQEFALPQMVEPWNELDNSRFEKSTRFYKKEFLRVCDALELVPDAIRDPGTGCKASKRLAVFVLLRRWSGAEHW